MPQPSWRTARQALSSEYRDPARRRQAAAHHPQQRRLMTNHGTESILFRGSSSDGAVADDALLPADDAPGPYTRSKVLAERFAMKAAASGFPVIVGCPTMPIGP